VISLKKHILNFFKQQRTCKALSSWLKDFSGRGAAVVVVVVVADVVAAESSSMDFRKICSEKNCFILSK
jgi:hypothetical protein